MTSNVELLPMPDDWNCGGCWDAAQAYARACVEANTEALRAEVEFARETLRKSLDADIDTGESLRILAIRTSNALHWRDQWRQEAEARAERLAEALQMALNIIEQEVPEDEYPDAERAIRAALHPTAAQEAES